MTEKELVRGAARRLAIIRHAQEATGNVALTCRYFGITRQAFYTWLRRYGEQGVAGLRDRSRRPHVIPHATKPEVVGSRPVLLTVDQTAYSTRTRGCVRLSEATSRL